MKKIIVILVLLFIVSGCGMKYPELDKNAIGFSVSEYMDSKDDNALYLTFEYNGRTYMPYGIVKKTLKEKDLDKCIGYIIQDENAASVVDLNNTDTRIYTLKKDKDNNYLMQYYIGSSWMNDPMFYRAIDTRGRDINTPKFIASLGYGYWEE